GPELGALPADDGLFALIVATGILGLLLLLLLGGRLLRTAALLLLLLLLLLLAFICRGDERFEPGEDVFLQALGGDAGIALIEPAGGLAHQAHRLGEALGDLLLRQNILELARILAALALLFEAEH